MKSFFSILWILSSVAFSGEFSDNNLAVKFRAGTGSRFQLDLQGIKTDLIISVSESSKSSVGIEYYFSGKSAGVPIELWQQFKFENQNGRIVLKDGYLLTKSNGTAEKIPASDVAQIQTMGVGKFLFLDGSLPDLKKLGVEEIQIAAGTVKALHFQQTLNGSVLDFWISDEAKPIGLVKLVSKGKEKYSLELGSLVSNVKPKIDPNQAVLSDKLSKELLRLPSSLSGLP